MTTDQRCQRCSASAYGHIDHDHTGVRGVWPGTCPFGDCGEFIAPTPTSSLEEARTLEYEREIRMDRYAREWIQAAREDPERRTDVTGEMLLRIIRLERAAARAEVIHEVEALRHNDIAWIPDALGREAMSANRGWNKAIDAVLRALSQGGEGKA